MNTMSKGVELNGKPLSAFAAKRAFRKSRITPHDATIETSDVGNSRLSSVVTLAENRQDQNRSRRPLKRKRTAKAVVPQDVAKDGPPRARKNQSPNILDTASKLTNSPTSTAPKSPAVEADVVQYSSLNSDAEYDSSQSSNTDDTVEYASIPVSNRLLSSFTPSDSNVIESSPNKWTVSLADGDVLTAIGHYDLWVRKGSVSILGAILHSSSKLHRVYAPASHSLPSIRHLRNPFGPPHQPAEISIVSCKTRIRLMGRVSRRFRRIWNRASAKNLEHESALSLFGSSFAFLKDSSGDALQRPLAPMIIPPEWQSLVLQLTDVKNTRMRAILVCGPKGSGKSTLTRLLTNDFVTKPSNSPGVYLLDLDPGQPEYSSPGDISLLHLKAANLGPSFTHPLVAEGSDNVLVRAHHVGAITPRDDPGHYMQCASDLYGHYRRRPTSHSACPLVVNSCGWIVGSGLELLDDLIRKVALTDVVYMSMTGPEETSETLQQAAGRSGAVFHTLQSQTSVKATRSAAELRAMQTQSYFHLDEPDDGALRWNASSIHTVRPLELHYAGLQQFILAIMILGDEMSLKFLGDLINGSILAVVAVEDDPALPEDALAEYNENTADRNEKDVQENADPPRPAGRHARVLPRHVLDVRPRPSSTDLTMMDAKSPLDGAEAKAPPSQFKPSIRRTPESIPYFFTGRGANIPLNPTCTRCIGQVLIRGIDSRSHVLQVLTPIPEATLSALHAQGTKLILVRGRLDMPTWAYEEECVEALTAQREKKRWRKYRDRGEVEDSEGYDGSEGEPEFDVEAWAERQPWVEVETGEGARRGRRGVEKGKGERRK